MFASSGSSPPHGHARIALVALALVAVPAVALAQPKPKPTPPADPAGAPAPAQPPAPAPAEPDTDRGEGEPGDDIDELRQEYLKLRDELYESRARAATVASALYSTKLVVKLAYTSGRFYSVDRAVIRLDGASVYDDTEGAIAGDDAVRFEGWIAPGRHVVTIRVEARGKDDDRFTSATEATFVVHAVAGKDLQIVARAKDGGDIPYEWSRGERGTYKLSIDADVRTIARPDAAGGKAGGGKAAAPAAPRDAETAAPATPKPPKRKRGASRQEGRRATPAR